MAGKYNTILQLAEDTRKRITYNGENWKDFLHTAGNLYKYSFQEQMLIYAQRPQATACASIELWNRRMNCWVNRGARGIALIDESSSRPKLKYVFDISDVHKARRIGRFPYLWKVKLEHEQVVFDYLEKAFGAIDRQLPFSDCVMELSAKMAKECYEEVAAEMKYLVENSFLEELDDLNLSLRIRETMTESIAYTILSGCGIDIEDMKEEFSFAFIHEFNTMEAFSMIGDAINKQVKPIMQEIGKAVRSYDRQAWRETQIGMPRHTGKITQDSVVKNPIQKELANTRNIEYNTLKHESNQKELITENREEREAKYGIEIQRGRGLPDTRYRNGRATERRVAEIRTDAERIPEGESEWILHGASVIQQVNEPPVHGTRTGRGANGEARRADGQGRRSQRRAESKASDALGAEDEQHPTDSRGNRAGGIDIQLIGDKETIKSIELVESDNEAPSLSGFSLSKEQPKEFYQQLSLFPSVEKQLENIAATEAIWREPENPVDITNKIKLHTELEKEAEKQQSVNKIDTSNFRMAYHESKMAGKGFAPKEKFRQNVEAIHTLEKIEGEHRIATTEEQAILAKYVGWGGLADAFDETKANWAREYQELKNLLSPEEYASARESTLNSHYTSPVVIQGIYDAVDRMGFTRGNILEPAMGTGNFFGMLPEKMQGSKLYGVELDGITGRIARQLYPNANVKITGFEKADFPNDFFDMAVGNVPFGQYKVADKSYDRYNFLIHDYFFAKTLDKVRPGGIVAFITSKGTMDKQNPIVRKYLAQKAELLGAIRLPNNAFKENAGTEVTSDILFFKKRDRMVDLEPDWVYLVENEDRIHINQYFADHPEMILGKMEMVSGAHGMETTCIPDMSLPLLEQLKNAISQIEGHIEEIEMEDFEEKIEKKYIPADPDVKNYSYTIVKEKVYYRENSIMKPVDVPEKTEQRMKSMIEMRDCTQELIDFQLKEYPEAEIKNKQAELNELYDVFSREYGQINSQANRRVFDQDSSYCLLCSLEKLDNEGNFKGKADMFTKRTTKKQEVVTSVDTASEALAVSLSEKAGVDLDYMSQLVGKNEEEIKKELVGVIFQNPVTEKWETADEYLSGNVREKLSIAKVFAENRPEYAINIASLESVQPKELDASEIEVRIGATWISTNYIDDFMREAFQTPEYLFYRKQVSAQYSDVTRLWNIKGKNADSGNTLANMTYGTSRANAYKILEDSLNLRDSRIFDIIKDNEGKEKRVLNKKETLLVSQKQEAIREEFKSWVFRDPVRRQEICAKYNELFNSFRPREYDGSHLKFPGMTPDISLRPHQLNAVAHQLYGGNTLLAHCVGAGKTFEMIAAAMENKRLGLCQKSLFVVPNHLTEQWASDFLRLYPGANILVATKKDFEPANRKKFCSRIATGEYDAVIIGHSQFEKIPLSKERQITMIKRQMKEIERAIEITKAEKGERYTIKQMEKTRKSLKTRLSRLNDDSRKDNVVTFEQLGVDRLFVDESHNYKNLFLYTKMRNVAGIAQTEAQKSSDMFAKCQYLDDVICCEL